MSPAPARQHCVAVADASQIGAARRLAAMVAAEARADDTAAGRVAIVATELATNLVRHAGHGVLLIQALDHDSVIEVLAVDAGRGMDDVERCLGDGYSTAGTPGNGLGAVRRLSQRFDIYTLPGRGCVVLSRVASNSRAASCASLDYGAVSRPLPGETHCGDGWRLAADEQWASFMMVDGLGHGPLAETAARVAIEVFDQQPFAEPATILQAAHRRMLATRGGALAIARLRRSSGQLAFAGIGNISAQLVHGRDRQGLVSHNGTVGAQMRRVHPFEYQWPADALLVMSSDGVSLKWQLSDYPGLASRHPALIAAVLHRDWARNRDDSSILVARSSCTRTS